MTIIYRAPGPHCCGVHQLGPGLAENSVAQCDACGRRYVLRFDDYGLSWTPLRWYHLMAQRGLRDEQVADMPAALPSVEPAHPYPHRGTYEPECRYDPIDEEPA